MSKDEYPRLEELIRRTKEWAEEHPVAAGLSIVLIVSGALVVYYKVVSIK